MAITLTRKEKNYLVALYGDISWAARVRLFRESSLPAQCGAEVLRDGYDFVTFMRDGSHVCRKLAEDGQRGRPRARRTFPYGNAGRPENRAQQARMKDTGHSDGD